MKMYSIFNIGLECDIPLPELTEIESAENVISVASGENRIERLEKPLWFHHWKDEDDNITISCARNGNAYILRFPQLVDFYISRQGDNVYYFPQPGVSEQSIRHLLIDQIIPRILGQRGNLVLHASVVAISGNTCVAFLGNSGLGKSTLAASFYQNGAELITDDCLLLEENDGQLYGIPNYYGVRLFDDSAEAIFSKNLERSSVSDYSVKSRINLIEKSKISRSGRYAVNNFFLLSKSTENNELGIIDIRIIRGMGQLINLLAQLFLLDVTDNPLIKTHFLEMKKLFACNTHFFRLEYPRNYEQLSEVRARIETAIQSRS